jgi:hypothetical protein
MWKVESCRDVDTILQTACARFPDLGGITSPRTETAHLRVRSGRRCETLAHDEIPAQRDFGDVREHAAGDSGKRRDTPVIQAWVT